MLIQKEQLALVEGKSLETLRREVAEFTVLSEYCAQKYEEQLGYNPLAMLQFLLAIRQKPTN